jgi:hypothetical protein
MPENFPMRDRLNKLCGEALDAWEEDGETLTDEDNAREMVSELEDALNEFAPSFCSFGAHEGDGSDFGFWPSIDSAKENCEFVSSRSAEFPESDFQGEWLHVSDHGNCTLYVRTNGDDKEVWSIV